MKSIWDVRFTKDKNIALDAAARDALVALDDWITINGSHVEFDGDGNVIHGAGGHFNNSNYYRYMNDKQYEKEHMAKLGAEGQAGNERYKEPDVSNRPREYTAKEWRYALQNELKNMQKRGASKDEINTIKEMIDKAEKDIAKEQSIHEMRRSTSEAAKEGNYELASLREGFANKAEKQQNASVEKQLAERGYSKQKIDEHERQRRDKYEPYIKNQKSIFGGSGWW